jgi:hypothetical protein
MLIVVSAFGLLGVIAVLRGVAGKGSGNSGESAPVADARVSSLPGATNADNMPSRSTSSTPIVVSDAVRAALIEKEIDQIHDLQSQSDETNNPMVIATLIQKLANPEAEVRKAALDALRQLNDTNAIPGLQSAEESLKDPRDKVAILDTIDYLKLPPIFPPPTDTSTNNQAPNK